MTSPSPIILPLVTPTTNAVGGGDVVAEKIGTFSNDYLYPSDSEHRTDQACWRFTATPAAGSRFIKLRIKIEVYVGEEVITFRKDVYSPIYRTYWFSYDEGGYWYKAGEPADWDTDGRFFIASCAGGSWYYPAWGIDGPTLTGLRTKSLSVTAFFASPGIIHSNGANGRLIYDVATGLPMHYG